MAEIRSMTDNLVERLRAEAAVFVGNALQAACGFDAEMDDVTGQLLDEAASELSRLHEALAAAQAQTLTVKPLDESKTQGWTDEKTGRFCLPLSDGYYIKFPADKDKTPLFMAWFINDPVGGSSRMNEAIKLAQDHHARRILSSLTSVPLPALLAETRKKALEEALPIIEGLLTAYLDNDEDGMTEHAEPIIAARAFLRSLSNEEAPK